MSDEDVTETLSTYLRLRGLEPSKAAKRRKRRRTDDDENQPFTEKTLEHLEVSVVLESLSIIDHGES